MVNYSFNDKKYNQRRRFDAEAPGVAAGDDGWELVTSCACRAFLLRFGETRQSGVDNRLLFLIFVRFKFVGRILDDDTFSSIDAIEVAGEQGADIINSGIVISSGNEKSVVLFGNGKSSSSFNVSRLYISFKCCHTCFEDKSSFA